MGTREEEPSIPQESAEMEQFGKEARKNQCALGRTSVRD